MARFAVSRKLKNGSKELSGTYSGIEADSSSAAIEEGKKRLNANHKKAFADAYKLVEIKAK